MARFLCMREGALPDFLALGVNEGDRGARNRVSERSESANYAPVSVSVYDS